jgi:alcohol dehydrogenase
MMMPHVINYNSQDNATAAVYAQLHPELNTFFQQLLTAAQMKQRLSERAIPSTALPSLASQAAKQWTAQFNPRPVDEAALLQIYHAAW